MSAPAMVLIYLPHSVRGLRPGYRNLVLLSRGRKVARLIDITRGTRLQLPIGDLPRGTVVLTRARWRGIARRLRGIGRKTEAKMIETAIKKGDL